MLPLDMLIPVILMSFMGDIELDMAELAAIDEDEAIMPVVFLCFILDMLPLDILSDDMDMPLPMADWVWAWVRAGTAAATTVRATAAAIGRKARMICFLCRVKGSGLNAGRLTRRAREAFRNAPPFGTLEDYVAAAAKVAALD